MKDMLNSKLINDKEFIKLIDKIMETEAYIEFLEEQLRKHLTEETRNKYRNQLKGAKIKLGKYNKKIYDDLKRRGDSSVKYVKEI